VVDDQSKVVKEKLNVPMVLERVVRTRVAAEVMSTPMPSPGMQAMRWILGPTVWVWDGIVVVELGVDSVKVGYVQRDMYDFP
jgi:hypothetical protein